MHVLVLGPLEVRIGDESPVHIRRGRPRTLLHSLILNRRVVLPVEVLADRLWEEDPPADASNAIHQLVSYLRRTLGGAGRDLLQTTATGYRLDVPDDCVDAWRMERLVQAAIGGAQAKQADLIEQALADATEAIRLWRGEPFAESAHLEWTAGDRARLQDVYLQAQESRIDAMLALGQHREAVLETQSLTAAYPLRERFHAQLSLGLYRTGRQSEALDAQRSVRELLARELGLDPGAELRELELAILNQDPSIEWEPLPGVVDLTTTSASDVGEVEVTQQGEVGPPAPHRVASPPFEIIGRGADLDRAGQGVSPGVIYTLTGPAGVGKTRLALAVTAARDSPAWFVDLDGLQDDAHVVGTVAAALKVVSTAGREPIELVVESLSNADGLLVLDNCEFVVGGVGELLRHLRERAPHLSVLVTSRRPLGLPREVVHRLTPLAVPPDDELSTEALRAFPAVQLWAQRARLVGASLELDDSHWQDVAAIVRGLDGLPMAIEIAAAQADVATTRTIRRRLEARLDSLVAEEGDAAPARSRSLAAAMEASVALLDTDEREFLYSLSTFPGPFDSEAAAQVAGTPSDTAYRMLASLVRQSLVTFDETYRLLAPVRAFALTRAEASLDMPLLRDRHARWVAEVAWPSWQESGGLRHTQELGELRLLMTDARVALEWACERRDLTTASRIAVGFSWVWAYGRADDGFTWLMKVKELSDDAPFEERAAAISRATVLRSLGLLANPRGELELASDVCSEASALSLRHGDRQGAAAALLTLAVAQWALGKFTESSTAADHAADLTAARPESWYHVTARVLRARNALDAGEPDTEQLLEQAVDVAQRAGDSHMVGLALACQSRHYLLAQALPAAEMTAQEALRVWRTIAYPEGEMMALNLLARVAGAERNIGRAGELATEALRIGLRTGHRGASCEAIESLALAAAQDGRREQALLMFLVSERERSRLGAPVPAADARLLDGARTHVRDALGDAAALVEARSRITRWDDYVAELAR